MTPRNRHPSRRHWPPYLYCKAGGYYYWRHPVTREEYGIGRVSFAEARTQAIQANLYVFEKHPRKALIDRLTGNADRTIGALVADYLGKAKVAPNTLKTYRSLAKRTLEAFGADTAVTSITPLQVSEALAALGHRRIAQAWRSFLRDVFREGCLMGWLDANPVRDTRRMTIEVKRSRLTWEQFLSLYEKASPVWLRNAIALAITTGQRREDIARARFADVRDGHWWVKQGKTGVKVAIPLDLRLDGFMAVGDAIRLCRTTGVVSPFLIHQTQPYGNSPVGSRMNLDRISKRFSELTEGLGEHPPTFHELRSLAARRYALQGVNVQALLGHRSGAMTEVYKDARGAEWVKILAE